MKESRNDNFGIPRWRNALFRLFQTSFQPFTYFPSWNLACPNIREASFLCSCVHLALVACIYWIVYHYLFENGIHKFRIFILHLEEVEVVISGLFWLFCLFLVYSWLILGLAGQGKEGREGRQRQASQKPKHSPDFKLIGTDKNKCIEVKLPALQGNYERQTNPQTDWLMDRPGHREDPLLGFCPRLAEGS